MAGWLRICAATLAGMWYAIPERPHAGACPEPALLLFDMQPNGCFQMVQEMNKKSCLLLVAASLLVITGCSKSAPKCSDTETLDLVKKIAMEELEKQVDKEIASRISLGFEAIRTTDANEKTGAQQCAADLIVTGPAGSNKLPITYKSERTDKADEFYVSVYGL